MDLLKAILGWWGLIGLFLSLFVFPKPETRKRALIQLFLSGPGMWILFIIYIPFAIKEMRKYGSN